MTNTSKPSGIQKEVMSQIQSGSVRMKPRVYFTVLWLSGIVASIAASLTFAYLINMLTYMIRIQTAATPAYGARNNLSESIASFPWWAVVLTIVFSALAIWLMKRYSRIYRYRISGVIVAFLLSSLVLGLVFSLTGIGHNGKKNEHSQVDSGRGYRRQK